MNWDTNYSTKVVPQPPSPRVTAIKETLLRYYLQQKQGQSADHAGLLPFQDMYGRPKFAVNHLPSQQVLVPSQMQAVALPLPGTKAPVAFKPKNWDDWYKHVAQNIYSAWSRAHVTAGSAIVQVTVWPSHDVDAKIVGFTPAPDVERNAQTETRFRSSALDAVNDLSGFGLWDFPAMAKPPKNVVFDMEFKHEVGGEAGCSVVHMHNQK